MSLPSEAAVRPLPSELETPPVTKRNLGGEEGERVKEVSLGEDEEAAEEKELVEEVEAASWLPSLIPASVFTGFNLTAIAAENGNLMQVWIFSGAQKFAGVLFGGLAFGGA